MKKSVIISFISGALIFGTVGAFAGQYVATENTFPIKINGTSAKLEGYNIEGSTYFKLRDIGDKMGFSVGFENNTILISNKNNIDNNPIAHPADDKTTIDQIKNYKSINGKYNLLVDFVPDEYEGVYVDQFTINDIDYVSITDNLEVGITLTGVITKPNNILHIKCIDDEGFVLGKEYVVIQGDENEKFKKTTNIYIPANTTTLSLTR